jgi:hypothetical protein
MRHSWVFEVLTDLRDYARANRLPRLAAKVEETIALARDEVAAQAAAEGSGEVR